jgi:hypothetical protein
MKKSDRLVQAGRSGTGRVTVTVPTGETGTGTGGEPPLGFVGVVSPMTSLGLAPFSYLGLVYPSGIVLTSAALYQVTFSRQQERIVADLLERTFDDVSRSERVRVYDRPHIEQATLTRQFATGCRLNLAIRGGAPARLIVQSNRVDEIRRLLPLLMGDAWTDETLVAA